MWIAFHLHCILQLSVSLIRYNGISHGISEITWFFISATYKINSSFFSICFILWSHTPKIPVEICYNKQSTCVSIITSLCRNSFNSSKAIRRYRRKNTFPKSWNLHSLLQLLLVRDIYFPGSSSLFIFYICSIMLKYCSMFRTLINHKWFFWAQMYFSIQKWFRRSFIYL